MATKKVPVSKTKAVDNTKKFNINDVGFTMTISIGVGDILRLLAEHDPNYAGLANMRLVVTDVFATDDDNIDITFDSLMQ